MARRAKVVGVDMGQLKYCAEVLSALPYKTEEEVLEVINAVTRLASLADR